METTKGRRERRGREGAGTVGRKARHRAVLGARERRRLAQLGICVVLFLVVFVGKGLLPEQMGAVREQLLEIMQTDTDFVGAFAEFGASVSRREPILDTLEGLWVEVFGGGGMEEAPEGALYRSQAAFLNGSARLSVAGQALQTLEADRPVAEPEAEDGQPEAAEDGQPEAAEAEPAVVYMEYDGPELPENTTMDRYSLSAVGVTETVTPALGWISSEFGWREHPVDGEEKFHNGVDLAVNEGTDVLAFAAGTVDYIGDSPVYGLYLQLDHGGGVKTFYAHCEQLCVQQGQTVSAGEVVARSGSTGNATGPHLHFEIKLNGVRLNPAYYIQYQ